MNNTSTYPAEVQTKTGAKSLCKKEPLWFNFSSIRRSELGKCLVKLHSFCKRYWRLYAICILALKYGSTLKNIWDGTERITRTRRSPVDRKTLGPYEEYHKKKKTKRKRERNDICTVPMEGGTLGCSRNPYSFLCPAQTSG
jgi:hypothetical protein